MKRIAAEHPFSDYWLYKVWHEKEGRYQANLVLISDTSKRTTISYARYLMSVKLGRLLNKNEHVDHVNNIKSDDSIENLQILSPEENKKKQENHYRQHNKIMLDLVCPCCGEKFQCSARNYRYRTKLGKTNFHCSRSCAVKMQYKNNNFK